MLSFETGLAREFARRHGRRIARELPGFGLPGERAMPGEDTVLRTFSSEWVNYDWTGETFWNMKPEDHYNSLKFLLGIAKHPVRDKLVLEVGIGIGGMADHMARREECEIIGMDLSHSVDAAQRHFGNTPFLHIVQGSAFAAPVPENSFDLVYSHGVIHHTFSTRTAFDRICRLPKIGGRLYIWVYSPFNEQRTIGRRALMMLEDLIRPLCWRLPERLQTALLAPLLPLYIVHQNFWVRSAGAGDVKYGWREALHAARDRFTPRYVHRHGEEEVREWFLNAGYQNASSVTEGEFPKIFPVDFRWNTGVAGVRGGPGRFEQPVTATANQHAELARVV
jgi:SAM-dependent methyltransferase